MAMDLNFSQESFAFSDIAPPSHVSGLESFSDFDASECSETSFAEIAVKKDGEAKDGTASTETGISQPVSSLENADDGRFSLGLEGLNANNINEFFEAIQNAESLGIISSSNSGKSLTADESSLGILQLDGLPEFGDNLSSDALQQVSLPQDRTLVGDDDDVEDEVVINHGEITRNPQGDDIPFTSDGGDAGNLTPPVNRDTLVQFEEERPDTGQDPDTFFSSHNKQVQNTNDAVTANEPNNEEDPLRHSYGQEELDMMLQGRSGSGDGGELIDRVSLTSSISFIQSQTFPESIFSQSFSSRGLGSGMDSRSESDGQEDNDDHTVPLLHGVGDGSHGSMTGRPGLEGANSDAEDLPTMGRVPLDASARLEAQGLELRQSAEGVDVLPDVLGDGGGGGDGSSGNNSDADDGGPAGAAYASSSANAPPSSTFPATIASFGFTHQPNTVGSHDSATLPASGGLTAGRGCPVGDVAADRSPTLLPTSPEQQDELQETMSSPHPSHFQASSTPMVRQENNSRAIHDETSALESYYLTGYNATPRNSYMLANTPHSLWRDDGSFHISQLQGSRPGNPLSEAESLTFDPSGTDLALASQGGDMTMIPRDTALEAHNNQFSNRGSGSSTALSNHSSEFSIKFSSSTFMNGSTAIDESQLWKSTPRDDGEAAMRATPGVLFQGHQRPSTVTGQAADQKQIASTSLERSSDGEQSTVLGGNSQMLGNHSSGQHFSERSHDRTLTPQGVNGNSTGQVPQVFDGGKSSAFPWPVEDNEQEPFNTSASFQAPSFGQPSWPFGGDIIPGVNPFDGESASKVSWMMPDSDFHPQGDPLAIIEADEQIFNKEHELEIPSQAQISDTSKIHDWTIPDSQYITRPSLLKVVGVNDPENKGEVRISFGAFLAAGSEELGSLSRTSPGRPRPHFGDEKPILTPSPKGAFKLISELTTPSDPFLPDNHSPDDLMNRPSVDGNTQESSHKVIFSPDETFQRPPSKEQWKRKDVLGEEATKPPSPSTNMLSFEMQKMKLDEQFKVDGSVKKRSRSASQTSSSSTGSIQSVIKKSDGKGTQSGRSIGGSDSRTKDRKRSHRKEKPEHQNNAKLDASSRSKTNSEQTFEELSMSLGKMSTLRRSSCGDASYTSSLEQMTQFIAQAINEDPEEIRKKLAAVQKNKTKVKSKKREGPPSEDTTESTNSERSDFNPLASSSPQRQISPERMTYSQVNLKGSQEQTLSDSPNRLSSYAVDDSVFPSEPATSMVPLSLKDLGSKDASSRRESMPSPETRSFHHIIPQFGETYTVRRAKKQADQQQNSHVIDPRKHRTHEIEERLNRSLPQNMESSVAEDNVQHPLPSERHPSNHELSTSHTHFSPLGRSDSAVGSMTTVLTQDVTNTRHSWPEASPRHHQLQKDFSKVDHVSGKTNLSEGKTKTDVSMNFAVPPDNFGEPVQLGNIGGGLPSNALMHGHHTGNLGNHQLAQTGVPLSFAQGIAPFDNPSSATHIYPSHNINGPVGIPGMMGPMLGTKTFGMQVHGPLSRPAPTTYGPGMVPLASAMYPPQGLGTLNTLHGHVPFVQTVSASMGPKPSSLTPTYVQSLNVEIPQNFSNQQIPLHLQTNMSNISELPTSFAHPRVSTSMLHQHTPPQQVTNGLLQVRPNFSQGAVTAATQEIIPGEIKFPPFCCVGVLTESVIPLHNSSSRWMHCEIHFILSTANGVQLPSSASAFSVQSKAIIAPHTTENVRISIEPAEAGTYTAQLQIYSFPVVCDMQPVTHSLGPVLALEVVAEEPRVEILLEEENSINFGEVSFGAKQCRPIHLVNRGRAQVPIRLIISANSSSLHCFGFADADFSPKDGVRNLASVKGSALTIHTLTLKGRQEVTSKPEPTVVLLLFQSPKVGLNSSSSAGPPEEYIARLDVEIDSARQGPTISSVALKAIEGVVRLHTPHKLQVLTLKSSVGKPSSCTIPVKNAGNITARVKLKIEGDTQQFAVKPDQLQLKPEEESEVQVTYQPAEANKQVQSLVVLAVPNGPVYELVVKGSATPKEEDKFTLLSSKPVLCWSGVALGWSQTQKVVLKTSSTSPVKLQLTIEGNHSDFQIQPTFSSHSGSPERHQSTLEPKKELPVHVSFSPSSMGLISSSLVIKSLTGRASSKIPLYGCGGTSQLVLVDVRQLSEGYIINIGEVSLGRKNSVKVRLRNSGTRAAFVKTVCYSDVHSLQQYPSTHLTVHPNNFILSERTSKIILIEYQPLERDAIKCRTSVNSVAAVAFYTGDEFLRRQYKRNLQRNPQQQFSPESKSSGPLVGLNFTTTFQDEDKLIEDVKYPKVPNWTTFFQSSVSRVLLTLVGSPPSSHPGNTNDPNRSVDTVPVSDKPAPKPQMNSPVMNGNLEEKSWAVIPDFLTMTPCKSQDDKSGKSSDQLRIVNFSERSLGFEFTWPGHAIVITPERGEIPPRSQTKVFVSAKPNPSNSLTHLPWVGTIYLNCDGVQQSIRVQIKEEQILESSPLQSGTLNFQSIPITASGGTPLPSHHLPPLRITNKDVMFGATLIGAVKTSEIALTNTAASDVSWNLCSVAPAYVKVDDTGSIHRTTYNAFSIPKLSGSLQGHGTSQIVVKFQPRDVGEYEQSWDLLTSSGGSKSKQKIFLHGQAVDKISSEGHFDDDLPAKTKKVTIKEPHRSTVGDKKGLYITDGVLQFPVTKIGSISEAKIKICNGSGEIQYLAHIASPTKPFSVNNKKFTIRPGRFVRLPVVFSPNKPGKTFETSLVITADPEAFLSVKLQGSSAE